MDDEKIEQEPTTERTPEPEVKETNPFLALRGRPQKSKRDADEGVWVGNVKTEIGKSPTPKGGYESGD